MIKSIFTSLILAATTAFTFAGNVNIFNDNLGEGWETSVWSKLTCKADQGKLKLVHDEKTKKWCGAFIKNQTQSNILSLADKAVTENTYLVITLKEDAIKSYQIALSSLTKNTKYMKLSKFSQTTDGEFIKLSIPLKNLKDIDKLDAVRGIYFQYTQKLQPGLISEIKSIQLETKTTN